MSKFNKKIDNVFHFLSEATEAVVSRINPTKDDVEGTTSAPEARRAAIGFAIAMDNVLNGIHGALYGRQRIARDGNGTALRDENGKVQIETFFKGAQHYFDEYDAALREAEEKDPNYDLPNTEFASTRFLEQDALVRSLWQLRNECASIWVSAMAGQEKEWRPYIDKLVAKEDEVRPQLEASPEAEARKRALKAEIKARRAAATTRAA